MLRKIYLSEWNYLKSDYRTWFFVSLGVCVLSGIGFYFVLMSAPVLQNKALSFLEKALHNILNHSQSNTSLFLSILSNNLRVSFETILFGIIPLVVFAFIPVIETTLSVSLVSAIIVSHPTVSQSHHLSPISFLIRGLLPHGIVELAGLFLANAIAVHLSVQVFNKLFSRHRSQIHLLSVFKQCFRSYLLLVVPLIVIAALIESFITPLLI